MVKGGGNRDRGVFDFAYILVNTYFFTGSERMNFEHILSHYGLYLTTYIVGVISGFVPVVNLEVYLVWVAAFTASSQGILISILATLGQMTAKTMMYLAGAGVLKISYKKPNEKLRAIQMKLAGWKHRISLFLFLSAFSGIPPFYLVSIAAGVGKIPFMPFVIAGLAGRFLRFTLTVFFPHLLKQLFG
jgi:membrane protein YqaA with SNARE-associated domain